MDKTWNIKPESFCIAPWTQMRIGNDGDISYCKRVVDNGVFSDGFDLAYEYNNNPDFVRARDSFLNGEFASGCSKCVNEATNKGYFRQQQNKLSAIHSRYLVDSLEQSPSAYRLSSNNIQPTLLLVMFNNQCNLACRMCSPKHSSYYAGLLGESSVPNGWSKDQSKWEQFKEFIASNDKLEHLQLNGGEALIQPEFFEVLDVVKDRTDLNLIITSNGTVFSEELMQTLQKFKTVFMDISIECFDNVNNYIRTGMDWRTVSSNIKRMISYKTETLKFGIHSTIQVYSIDKLYTVMDFCLEHDLELIANNVFNNELRVHVLPIGYRQELYHRVYQKYSDTDNVSVRVAHNSIREMLLDETPRNELTVRKFVEETKRLDAVLSTDFATQFPHYMEFFKGYGF